MNILYLYDSTQTYTNAVYEHIFSFARYSKHRSFYCHLDRLTEFNIDISAFDAIGIHFSVRLSHDRISTSACEALQEYCGEKFLFIQDEYDRTYRAWYWIELLGINLVFTVVPEKGIGRIYPFEKFPKTRFVSNLTGYVPDSLVASGGLRPPSQRTIVVGYRGRPLPVHYGKLGQEKVEIGKLFKSYCNRHRIRSDIAWSEKARIYGTHWYEFLASCRAMLGSESGSNVFDWDGSLAERIARYRIWRKWVSDRRVYDRFVRKEEIDGVMNQVSPRIFEAIATKTVLVLFEGDYSGVVKAGEHFIAVKKDGSNIPEIMRLLENGPYVDAMVDRAYRDVIASGKYSYHAFVAMVDSEIEKEICRTGQRMTGSMGITRNVAFGLMPGVTPEPERAEAPQPFIFGQWGIELWGRVPESHRAVLRPTLKKLLKRR